MSRIAIRTVFFSVLTVIAFSSQAFMPATGLWSVDVETNGSPGRGFTIEVENEVLVLAYYGYRLNGSSTFYLATGPILNNTFTAELNEYSGGASLGAAYRSATSAGSAGTVSIQFSDGLRGVVTFPGETPKAISKFAFGYGNSPSGLLGTYLFAYHVSPSTNTDTYTLTSLTGRSTSGGNGVVTDSQQLMACENQLTGVLAGSAVCAEVGNSGFEDAYFFRMSGDRGSGYGSWTNAASYYPLQVLRTATKTGISTGIGLSDTNATAMSASMVAKTAMMAYPSQSPNQYPNQGSQTGTMAYGASSADKEVALKKWVGEVKTVLRRP